jgi:hypothetical protein
MSGSERLKRWKKEREEREEREREERERERDRETIADDVPFEGPNCQSS